MNRRANTLFEPAMWIGAYLLFAVGPLLVLMLGRVPPSGGFAWDLAMSLGYAAMGMLGMQFVLTARFRRAAAPFGIDVVYCFHRWLGLTALGLVLAHYLLILVVQPDALGAFDPVQAPWYMTAGRLALLAFVLLIAASLWRRRLHLEYDAWRRWHALLAALGFIAALAHIEGVGRYLEHRLAGALWLGAAAAWLGLMFHVRVIRPWRLIRRPYRIADVRAERGGSLTLALAPEMGAPFDYQPGQFIWLALRCSPFSMREHPFSLSSTPTRPGRLEVTIKPLGDFTRSLRDIAVGEPAYVDGPYGAFSIDRFPQAPGAVFIAGGVGIAPIVGMLRALADRGDARPFWLFYGSACLERTLFLEEIETMRHRLALRVVHVLHEPEPTWSGETGYLDEALLRRHLPEVTSDLEFFVCGPPPMIRLAEVSLAAIGIKPRHVRSELFDLA